MNTIKFFQITFICTYVVYPYLVTGEEGYGTVCFDLSTESPLAICSIWSPHPSRCTGVQCRQIFITIPDKVLRLLLQQAGLNRSEYSSHSFRIGAATTAAAAGIPSWMIKSLGRCASNAYLSYIHRSPRLTPAAINKLMSRTDATNQIPWDADQQPALC